MDQDRNISVGNVLIPNLHAYVLIDSSVTHYFISFKFVQRLDVNIIRVRLPLEVSIPFGKELNRDNIVKTVTIKIDGRSLEMELYLQNM